VAKNNNKKINGDELRTAIETLIPNASFDEDNYGQIVIYTHLKEVDDDVYVEMTEQDFDESE